MEEFKAHSPVFSLSPSIFVIMFIFTFLLCWYAHKAVRITKIMYAHGMEFRSRRLGLSMFSAGIVILVLLTILINDQHRLLTGEWTFKTGYRGDVTWLFLLYMTPLACGIGNVVLLADSFLQWWAQATYSERPGHWSRGVSNIFMCVMPWVLVRLFSVDCLCDCHRQRFRTYSAVCAMIPACIALLATGMYMCIIKKRVLIRTIMTPSLQTPLNQSNFCAYDLFP